MARGSRIRIRLGTGRWFRRAREAEVIALMAQGQSNTAIAEALVVLARAVEKHIASIFTKLDLPPDSGRYHRRVMAVVRYLNS